MGGGGRRGGGVGEGTGGSGRVQIGHFHVGLDRLSPTRARPEHLACTQARHWVQRQECCLILQGWWQTGQGQRCLMTLPRPVAAPLRERWPGLESPPRPVLVPPRERWPGRVCLEWPPRPVTAPLREGVGIFCKNKKDILAVANKCKMNTKSNLQLASKFEKNVRLLFSL